MNKCSQFQKLGPLKYLLTKAHTGVFTVPNLYTKPKVNLSHYPCALHVREVPWFLHFLLFRLEGLLEGLCFLEVEVVHVYHFQMMV